jgi:hypothetical protein
MCRKLLLICILGAFFTLGAGMAKAQQIRAFVWNNDNASHYTDPDDGVDRQCEYGILQALSENDVDYSTSTILPSNLSSYDIVFVELGIYCVG